ncbi:hypothetical protein KC319_g23288, partial [Hortaea werneckii]
NQELLDLVNSNYESFLDLGQSLRGGEEKVEGVRVGGLGFLVSLRSLEVGLRRLLDHCQSTLHPSSRHTSQSTPTMATFGLPSEAATTTNTTTTSATSDISDDDDLSTLPLPQALSRTEFLAPNFNPHSYLTSLNPRSRHQTLEDLRTDLRQRSQQLNQELLDLVNSNYESFLDLGQSLRGGEEKVEGVRVGGLGF